MDGDTILNVQLFDSASKNFKKSESFKIDDHYFCMDDKNELIKLENQSDIENNFFLFHISFNEKNNVVVDNLIIGNNTYQRENLINELDNKLWYLIQSKQGKKENRKYNLTKGDIIKLGNIKFLVNDIYIENSYEDENKKEKEIEKDKAGKIKNPVNIKNQENFNVDAEDIITNKITEVKECIFCNSYSSYYFQICECDKKVHFPCFQKFFEKKLISENNDNNKVNKYLINDFFCINCLCYYSFSYKIYIQNENEEIILNPKKFKNPIGDYIILESLGTKEKIVYVIDLNKGDIKIGNSENKKNDMIIKDNSIKEEHAIIKCDNKTGNIWIESLCNDDFNLSVLVRYEIELNEEKFIFKVGEFIFSLNIGSNEDTDGSNDEEERRLLLWKGWKFYYESED